ncbi:MAG: PucR family transcriptional regulator, partial [Thermocrispum sp.]
AEGYAEARAREPRRSDRARHDLVRLIMSEHPADPDSVARTARSAGWTVPDSLTVIALQPLHDRRLGAELPPADQLGEQVLAGVDGDTPYLIVPDGETPLSDLCRMLPGHRLAAGPAVRITDVRASLRVARRALDLADRGVLPGDAMLDCAEHHTVLTLFADDWLVDRLVQRRLAPLDGLTERQQDRMLVTLHEWLITRGQVTEIGERLRVHPQTVRYRLKKLEELFGTQLSEPESRFELALAVRAKLQRRRTEESTAAAG